MSLDHPDPSLPSDLRALFAEYDVIVGGRRQEEWRGAGPSLTPGAQGPQLALPAPEPNEPEEPPYLALSKRPAETTEERTAKRLKSLGVDWRPRPGQWVATPDMTSEQQREMGQRALDAQVIEEIKKRKSR
jgi:hypothetical protein